MDKQKKLNKMLEQVRANIANYEWHELAVEIVINRFLTYHIIIQDDGNIHDYPTLHDPPHVERNGKRQYMFAIPSYAGKKFHDFESEVYSLTEYLEDCAYRLVSETEPSYWDLDAVLDSDTESDSDTKSDSE